METVAYLAPPPPPPPLYPFQEEGVRFLVERPAALLCDEMGLGKSIQAICAARRLFAVGKVRRALVLCPKTLLWDWWRKVRRWAPELICCPVYGPPSRRIWYWQWPKNQIFLCGYETWRVDSALPDARAFDLVILDEIQRIKNPATQLARAVAGLRSPIRWGLSGTPLENRLEELLAVFSFLLAGAVPGPSWRTAPSPAEAREALAPFMLRRRKAEVLAYLPPKLRRDVWVDLHPAQRAAYEAALAAARGELPGPAGGGGGAVLGLLTRLKEICNLDPATGASSKVDYILRDLPDILARGEKVLVFSQFPEKSLLPLLPRFEPFGAALFSGELSQWQRDELLRRFEEDHWPRVLLMSLKAGGVGLTLTRANHVYHLDHWWNPAAAEQAEDRVHRIGQHRTVFVTGLLARDTIEERIAGLVEQKRRLLSAILDGEGPAAGPRARGAASFTAGAVQDEVLSLVR
ncbi:DEAD/DEAH box helicase [Caldinitratiruptor microaerophilus]|uniref:Helicase conserved C-terminal domain-containing protein n=1 Tax=Caldinitratiruptor microaerophilus TaxID=671077 RepID=A0AA35G8D8_9FIRM|nr:DEAD/DEAH box helicase [Caldinitratiruptor microaerophilus]BDG60966.1 hypothetical protein caldi_20560 [Caldinitratiruptor microaerophilus]